MIEINWRQDYQREFICPYCNKGKMRLAGTAKSGKQKFVCKDCQRKIFSSIDLSQRSCFLESRLKDEQVDWGKDYQGEFICPKCHVLGMTVRGIKKNMDKRYFPCSACRHACLESYEINIQAVADPSNPAITWYTNHRIKDFICPECQAQNIYFGWIEKKSNKKTFKCRTCKTSQYESIYLTRHNIAHYSKNSVPVKAFNWAENEWDLRAINPNFDLQDSPRLISLIQRLFNSLTDHSEFAMK